MRLKSYLKEDILKVKQLVKKAKDLGGIENNPFGAKQQKANLIWHELTRLIGREDDRLDGSNADQSDYAYELAYSLIEDDWKDIEKKAKKLKIPIKKEYLKLKGTK